MNEYKVSLNNYEYIFTLKITKNNITTYVLNDKNIIGDFNIYSENLFIPGFTHSLTIGIEDKYQKLGLSKYLIYFMIQYIINNYPTINLDMLFYIDTDASSGFWDYIGMTINRYGYRNRNIEGNGYEKKISLRQLKKFVNFLY